MSEKKRVTETKAEDQKIRMLLEATASLTGNAFFKALVKSLAQVLDVSASWVTVYRSEERRLNSLAMWVDGAFVDEYNYDVAGTPCEPVVESCGIAHFKDRSRIVSRRPGLETDECRELHRRPVRWYRWRVDWPRGGD